MFPPQVHVGRSPLKLLCFADFINSVLFLVSIDSLIFSSVVLIWLPILTRSLINWLTITFTISTNFITLTSFSSMSCLLDVVISSKLLSSSILKNISASI
ncbi:hypothetical protein [Spiroplasma endosymbiont of Virgichneumon dumeticola]|uniref:hypothetical protein n=1 Tax=Spiroplasma endosymbiont of Virgichneumon dumeticola TaxID=3139323 RepID=UPI0035C8D606